MYGENPIGKKVNLLEKVGICDWKMNDTVCEIVNVIPWSQELNDYCQHYIVKDADGKEKEVREAECVFSPDYTKKNIDETIFSFLNDNGVWSEVYCRTENIVVVDIDWGDWRHQHLWAETLMGYLGYTEIGNRVTEEDGSDCYSAEHYFLKAV